MTAVHVAILGLAALVLTGCSVIGDIFEAGVWTGVIALVLVAAGIIFAISKFRK